MGSGSARKAALRSAGVGLGRVDDGREDARSACTRARSIASHLWLATPPVAAEPARLSQQQCGYRQTGKRRVPNALELFQSDSASGVFGGAHQRLADAVVRVALEARLLPAQGLEFVFGRASLAALQIAAAVDEGAPLLFDARATVDGGIG